MRKRLPRLFRTSSMIVAGLLTAPAPASAVDLDPEFSASENRLKARNAFDSLNRTKARRAFDALPPADRERLLSSRIRKAAPAAAKTGIFLRDESDDCRSMPSYSENSVGFRIGVTPDGLKFRGGPGESLRAPYSSMRKDIGFCDFSRHGMTPAARPDRAEHLDNLHGRHTQPPFTSRHLPASALGESLRRQHYADEQQAQAASPLPMPVMTDTYREGRSSRTPHLPGRVIVTTPGGSLRFKP
ncbi:hypothetical protein [Collimonas pratensis]|uniref:Uncharacterized protein n=1 Tax=Collimonas pratensis TaxID=279113 RepID=A0ABN4M9H4_9BURK|nr:hypothetical protein [Collimonas pratensis]AMP14925.1 hypothetical protein CPter291_2668 [Collimonas pratensis]